MERKIIITSDGSKTIYIPELNECYHSKNGALAESLHIFINAGYRFAAEYKLTLNILEIGFGTGLNALLTLIEANNDPREVNYLGVEPYRVDKKMLDGLNYPELTGVPEANNFFEEIHKTTFANKITGHFTLSVSEDKIEDIVLTDSFFDLVYFDAFAPLLCPELWSPEVFQKIYKSMNTGGVLVTYSCKGDVKRALKSAGFSIEKLPGPVGKREFLRAVKIS
ncbi:MAG TPA: tRNA (5-methylaminomethyl-2-thiouridine)(34)-methyltransferase MnmD [Bacteroidales bacterium]|nr:tRNA (5-methylaminomethyl-2-thiouridine)(34)-methyltransferase MnmD [Bacteroidales bacterium]